MLPSFLQSFHAQSKSDKLKSEIKDLESLLTEMAADNEELQRECEKEAEKCHSMEVYTFITAIYFMFDCSVLGS